MAEIKVFDNTHGYNWLSFERVPDALFAKSIPPTHKEVLELPYSNLIAFLRKWVRWSPEYAAVMSVATTQVQAHVFEATGGRNSRTRAMELYREADDGDGGETLLGRLWRDYALAGWCINGIQFRGAQISGVYHIDAAYTRTNTSQITYKDREYPRAKAPLVYEGKGLRGGIPIERDPDGKWTEAFWGIAFPRSKEEIKGSGGWRPGELPLLAVYDRLRLLQISRMVHQARGTGETPTKITFVKNGTVPQTEDAQADAEQRQKEQNDMKPVGTTLFVETIEDPVLGEVIVREAISIADMQAEEAKAKLTLCSILGVNPIDVDPSLSGAGGLNEGTKAQVADDLRDGRLVAQFVKWFTVNVNHWVMPARAEVKFTFNDPRDEQRRIAQKSQLISAAVQAAPLIGNEAVLRDLAYEEVFAPGVIVLAEGDVQTVDETENDDAEALIDEPTQPPDTPADGEPPPPPIAKANRVEVLTLAPKGLSADDDLAEIASALRDFGKTFVAALQETVPVNKGVLRKTIRYAVINPGTTSMALKVYAGNAERPELVVRVLESGRRGFGPKDPDGWLVFEGSDGETVYTKHVEAQPGKGWIAAAWDMVQDDYDALVEFIGKPKVKQIKVDDVKIANAPHIDGYKKGGAKTVKAELIR